MNLRLMKHSDLKQMPWKNGGGMTAEVAIEPKSAQLQTLDFEWRVSMATIESEGPFSNFPGYDRKLIVWKGEGLFVNGSQIGLLEPFEFSGEEKIEAKLISGAVKDFGIISRRDVVRSTLTTYSLQEEQSVEFNVAGDAFILCARGELRVGEFYLNPGDVVHAQGHGKVSMKALDLSKAVVGTVSP